MPDLQPLSLHCIAELVKHNDVITTNRKSVCSLLNHVTSDDLE